ncbi:MAG: hypothetical protein R8L53_05650 [Mariprofundales bacterium]
MSIMEYEVKSAIFAKSLFIKASSTDEAMRIANNQQPHFKAVEACLSSASLTKLAECFNELSS